MGPWVHNKENKMKKRLLALSLAAGCTALFTACDETTNTDIMNASTVTDVDSLPECNKAYDGMLATVSPKGEIYVCTQGSWESVAKTMASSTPGSDNTAGCIGKTSDDGVQIVCNGKTVTTLKNGSQGLQGDQGATGTPGKQGANATNGTKGSDGASFKPALDECSVHYKGQNVVVYNCADETYMEDLSSLTASLRTWDGLQHHTALYSNGSNIGTISTVYLPGAASGPNDGNLVRWKDDDAWSSGATLTLEEISKNNFIGGTASLTVVENAGLNATYHLEPSVGVMATFSSTKDLYAWGGLCLTYTSEKPMELILTDNYYNVARAPLAAASKVTTVNILATAFIPDSLEKVKQENLNKSVKRIFVKALGTTEVGADTNKFAVYQLGAYKRCNGTTINDVEEWAKKTSSASDSLVDDRDPLNPVKYGTVTIGNQTWMAQNLRAPYDAKTVGADGTPGTSDDVPMALCPTAPDELVSKGCLYSWAAAMDSVGLYNPATVYQDSTGSADASKRCGYNTACTATAPVKGICPDGWHLPSKEEIETLVRTSYFALEQDYWLSARALAASADNWLGFSAVPAGYTNFTSVYDVNSMYMWSSIQQTSVDRAYYLYIDAPNNFVDFYVGSSSYGRSVRCVKNQGQN